MNRHLTLLAGALLASGCGIFSDEPYLIDELTVVAIVAEPPEIRAGETTLLTVWVVDPHNLSGPITTAWSTCTSRGLAENARDCSSSGELSLAADESILLGPGVFATSAERRITPAQVEHVPSLIMEAGFWEHVRLRASSEGEEIEAIKRVVVIGADTEANTNPVIEEVHVEHRGQRLGLPLAALGGIELLLTPAYDAGVPTRYRVLGADGTWQERVEEPSFTWHVIGGQLDRWVTAQGEESVTWTLPEADEVDGRMAHVFVVLRDGRGGADVWMAGVELQE